MKKLVLALFLSLFLSTGAMAFSDVSEDYVYYDAITWAEENGVVEGYEDGTFKPDNTVNRAEFLKIIYEARDQEYLESDMNFNDVFGSDWFEDYVSIAVALNTVEGYEDGSFRPGNPINFVEAAKILALDNKLRSHQITFMNKWYHAYLQALENEGLILLEIEGLDQNLTRGQLVEMMYRYQNSLEKDSQSVLELYMKENSSEIIELEMPEFDEVEVDLSFVEEWAEEGRVLVDYNEYPLPWSSYDDSAVVSESGVFLLAGEHRNLFAAAPAAYIAYVEDENIEKTLEDGPGESEYDVNIKLEGEWLTFPYRNKWVGSVNLETGEYKLVELPRFFTEVVFDGEKYVYIEKNAAGCALSEDLFVSQQKVLKDSPRCGVWVYDEDAGEEVYLTYTKNYIGGLLEHTIYSVDENYVWLAEKEWECPNDCIPSLTKYDAKTGEYLGRVFKSYGFSSDLHEPEPIYFELVDEDKNVYKYEIPYFRDESGWARHDIEQAWQDIVMQNPGLKDLVPADFLQKTYTFFL